MNALLSAYRIEQELTTENLNTSLLDNLTTAVIVLDKDLRLVYVNPAAEALLETSGKHIHGLYIADVLLNSKQLVKSLKNVEDNGVTFIARKVEFTKLNTNKMTVDYSASRLIYKNDTFVMLELQELDRSYNISRKEMLISNHETTLGSFAALGMKSRIHWEVFAVLPSYWPKSWTTRISRITPTSLSKRLIASSA